MNFLPPKIHRGLCSLLILHCSVVYAQSVFEINPDSAKQYIYPAIYGVNTLPLSSDAVTNDLPVTNLTAERIGGNRVTGYNWENNASNAGLDWNHNSDNHLLTSPVTTETESGGAMVTFMKRCKNYNCYSTIQLPMAGYVAADMSGSVSVEEAAPSSRWKKVVFQKGSDFTLNPLQTDDNVYVDEFVNYMVQKFGKASEGGVKSYCLDNEPGLWNYTHPRIHPQLPTAEDIINRSAELSLAVKAVDPTAEILGFEAFGWMEFLEFTSATGWENYQSSYDWAISAYLGEMKKKSDAANMRLLDVLTVHWYPEATGDARISFDTAGTEATVQARYQAPRSLWDSTYVENSWITNSGQGDPINLLPRLKQSVDTWYPGTKIGITEYSYGGEGHISGGLALSDVLGIFGREGIYLANLHTNVRGFLKPAFQLFRNFDGKYNTFGDTSVAAISPSVEEYSIYASIDSENSKLLHVILINKKASDSPVSVNIKGSKQYKSGIVYGFTEASTEIARMEDVDPIANNNLNYTAPAYSALHFILSTDDTVDLQTPDYYTLTINTLGNGLVNQSINGARFKDGTEVTLTAVPASGWEFYGWVGADSSTNTTISLTMNENKTIEARFSTVNDLIPNGDFSNDLSNWTVNTWSADGSSQGNAEVVDGVLKYTVINGGPETWNIQIYQNPVSFIKGKAYKLTFDAWAEAAHPMNVWTANGALSKEISLTTAQTTYSYTFIADTTEASGRLSFDIGGNGAASAGVVYLDNVSLIQTDSITAIKKNLAFNMEGTEFVVYSSNGPPTIVQSSHKGGPVTLSICDLSGKTAAVVYSGPVHSKRMTFKLDGNQFGNGLYIIRLKTPEESRSGKIMF